MDEKSILELLKEINVIKDANNKNIVVMQENLETVLKRVLEIENTLKTLSDGSMKSLKTMKLDKLQKGLKAVAQARTAVQKNKRISAKKGKK